MDKIDDFKAFIKLNPSLIRYVQNGDMTWQSFYELYDIYGSDNVVWDKYLKEEHKEEVRYDNNTSKNNMFGDIMNMAKRLDVNKVQNGINSMQKILALAGDLFVSKKTTDTNTYTPRPIYQRFDD